MYTQKEALQLAEFYHDKVIGQPLNIEKAKGLIIKKIKIKEASEGGYNIYCYATGSSSVDFYAAIQSVVKSLGLPFPNEVLEGKV